jgi:DNA-binding NarL/FixJ family response regulator
MKKLLLVDDHPIVALGLQSLLEDSSDFTLDHVATCNQEAIELASHHAPDIFILDLVLPGRSGIEIIPMLREICPTCRIVIYSSLDEELYAARTIKAGAQSYVHKEAGLPQLLKALYAVSEGKIFVSENVQQDMLHGFTGVKSSTNDLSVLSNQELNVFRLIGNGLRSSDIAEQLGISPKTVGTHRERIKNKLTLHTGKELDQLAMSHFSFLPKD